MFNSVFSDNITVLNILLMVFLALLSGVIYSYLISRKLRSSKGVFITTTLMPMVVSIAICLLGAFLSSTTSTVSRIATLAVALGLIRFRSTPGSSEEMMLLLGSVIIGLVFGLGYLAFGCIASIVIAVIYLVLASTNIFKNKSFAQEKLLKITIPESLDYKDVFDEVFDKYLKDREVVEVKTTAMGSMFKLSYRVIMKDETKEKEMIDELRVRNGNLEISMLPYVPSNKNL